MRECIRCCEVWEFEDQWMAQINMNFSTFINVQHYQGGSWGNVLLFKDDLATSLTSIISVCSATIPSSTDASNKGEVCENRELGSLSTYWLLWQQEKGTKKSLTRTLKGLAFLLVLRGRLCPPLFITLYRKHYVYLYL